jgi:hypothetical protein
MSEAADHPEEPYWVAGLRAKGYTVRTGTGTGGIPFEPEVAFTPPNELRHGLRRRVIGALRKLWNRGAVFKRHTTLPGRHASLP